MLRFKSYCDARSSFSIDCLGIKCVVEYDRKHSGYTKMFKNKLPSCPCSWDLIYCNVGFVSSYTVVPKGSINYIVHCYQYLK